jgi:Tfp pilus assembly protein PilF
MAHTTIDKAIQKAPHYANLYDSKGEFYMLAGDRENAQAMYDKVVETDSMFYVHCTWSKLHDYINNQIK